MAEKDYSKREIDLFMREIKETLARQDKLLIEIKEQTTKTNGRVTKLERNLLIAFVAIAVTTVIKFPELLTLIKIFT